MTKDRNKRLILFIETAAAIFTILMVIIESHFSNRPLLDYKYYLWGALLFVLSIFITQFKNKKTGFYVFLTNAILITFHFDYHNTRPGDDFFSIFSLYMYLLIIIVTIFILEHPQSTIGLIIGTGLVSRKLITMDQFDIREKHYIFMLSFLVLVVLYLVKRMMNRLTDFRLDSMRQLNTTTLSILGKVSEINNRETSGHLQRVEIIIEVLIKKMQEEEFLPKYIDDKYLEDIKGAAFLHDIGKIGIPVNLISKKEALTTSEYEIMKTHTTIGYDILKEAKEQITGESLYDLALDISRHHHERWDGTGYPDNLKGEEIPLSARIMAIVDVYDALISNRSYKSSIDHKETINIIRKGSGTQFDPKITDIFIKHSNAIFNKLKAEGY